ncbi:MAG TPA: ABC transporter permease subunit, partial [Pseudomonadales bacterium]|nr:ABC transporter permease subunit [Pseudomonadales bacterium]
GATPWQTMVRIILPTASPGIFSGIMIGFGRAVGETMIVLMSTGNTPVMDVNIFSGLRSLSANIAVEMGEAEVGSSHFRILFLSALVLFVFTFIINTTAELVRQRLREKYGKL